MSDWKRLFSRSLAAAPGRLHFAAHSHHLWPDASYVGQIAAWQDAARLADRKWDRVMEELWPAAQRHVAAELSLPDPSTVVFAANTHDLLVRIVSAHPRRPLRVLTTDGEFHSARRQLARWAEAGAVALDTLSVDDGLEETLLRRAHSGDHDLILVSQVMFSSGRVVARLADLAALARPEGPWLLIDGYHGFMAIETDLSEIGSHAFYTAGGYKYAMAGEGAAFLHAPPGFGPHPRITGWFAEFEDLTLPPGAVGYAADARRFLGSTFDPSGLYRFVAVRDMLAEEGLTTAAVNAHVAGLRTRLLAGLADTALSSATLLNPGGDPRARFLALASPSAAAWQSALMARDVVTDVRGNVLRIGLGLYQDEADIDRLLDISKRL